MKVCRLRFMMLAECGARSLDRFSKPQAPNYLVLANATYASPLLLWT